MRFRQAARPSVPLAPSLALVNEAPRERHQVAILTRQLPLALLLGLLSVGTAGCRDKPPPPPAGRHPAAPASNAASDAAKAVEHARQAATSAAQQLPEGASHCERAWAERRAAAQRSNSTAPTRRFFLRRCERLPSDVQRCLSLGHAMSNAVPCRKQFQQLSEEQRQLMAELSSPEPTPSPSAEAH